MLCRRLEQSGALSQKVRGIHHFDRVLVTQATCHHRDLRRWRILDQIAGLKPGYRIANEPRSCPSSSTKSLPASLPTSSCRYRLHVIGILRCIVKTRVKYATTYILSTMYRPSTARSCVVHHTLFRLCFRRSIDRLFGIHIGRRLGFDSGLRDRDPALLPKLFGVVLVVLQGQVDVGTQIIRMFRLVSWRITLLRWT